MIDLLQRLGNTVLASAIRENFYIFPWLEVLHVMAIAVVLGTLVIVDLRLIGLASMDMKVSRLLRRMLPLTWTAFAIAAASGALLFLSQPVVYFQNFAFRLKLVMLVAAGLNMTVFHLSTQRNMAAWDAGAALPRAARLAGALSISIWIVVASAGRWIGFTLV